MIDAVFVYDGLSEECFQCFSYSRKVNIGIYAVILGIFIGVIASSAISGQVKIAVACCFATAHAIALAIYFKWYKPRALGERIDQSEKNTIVMSREEMTDVENYNHLMKNDYYRANRQIEGALGKRDKYEKIQGHPTSTFRAESLPKAIMEAEFEHPDVLTTGGMTMDFYVIKYKRRNHDHVYVMVLYQMEFIDHFKDAEWYAIGETGVLFVPTRVDDTIQVTHSSNPLTEALKQLVDGAHPRLVLAGEI